ncbi:hypothetical protein BN159_6031 [Streptomyces davaonensis JCM 4913]|uniref:Knr4/Smi1-like domain-containing protein n=1 Tax=Streptomyces davaonensis (strain DSM 101723 / JCM 4913 / KCC S-0913 / 768) TaxID=1214101 RepID=K4RB45_STRDJ|nr:hypothetical protein [Streptomyces davaonensis]CCK30410.1 hypothetical protein BN159_6031 [Streptomyces davaonensis JCM 4913]
MSVQHDDEAERVAVAWRKVTDWLAEHAPVSHASLLPPAPEAQIVSADSWLRERLGFGLPTELAALWRLCGGVEHQYIEANEEEGEVGSGAFLPGGILLGPVDALGPRLPETGRADVWGAAVVPWLTGDESGPESGHYVGEGGVGRWSLPDDLAFGRPAYPSIAAYLEAVHRTLTEGPADAMGPDVPGLVWGCLIWDDPEAPMLDDALEDWHPVH